MDETQKESVTPDYVSQVMEARKCLNCGRVVPRGKQLFRRGLCQACYQVAHEAIGTLGVKWEDLVKRGIALPKTKGGRRKSRRGVTPLDLLIDEVKVRLAFKEIEPISHPKPVKKKQ